MILIDANLLVYAHDTRSPHHAAARPWLEAVLVGIDVAIEVLFEKLVMDGSLRMAGAIIGAFGLMDKKRASSEARPGIGRGSVHAPRA